MASMNDFDDSMKKSNLYYEVEVSNNACNNKNPPTLMCTVVFPTWITRWWCN